MSVIWQPRLDAEAQRWRKSAVELTRERFALLAAELDRDQRYPWENISALVESGLAGVFIPKAYGGRGASLTATVAAIEAVGQGCASTAAILCTYQLGAFPILLGGSEEQKKRYLSEMAKGVSTSFALSERCAGSDAAAIETKAEKEGDDWRLRGEKYWIGNGGASRYYVVFAKTDPKAGGRGISAFIVDKQDAGVTIDELSDKMGIRGTQTSNLKLDTVVPAAAQVGERNRALRLALQTLNVGRIMVAAQSIGLSLAAYREASDRAVTRSTFGRPIFDNQGIAFKLADMATEITAARMLLYEAARVYDAGEDVANVGAMAKLYSSEVAHRAVDCAVQIWGGLGYCKPSLVERLYRDQRIVEIYEGSSEIQRVVLSRAVRKEAEMRAVRPESRPNAGSEITQHVRGLRSDRLD
jgi:alkylation response protein AidB-like acyl-CoA dehydrogenase